MPTQWQSLGVEKSTVSMEQEYAKAKAALQQEKIVNLASINQLWDRWLGDLEVSYDINSRSVQGSADPQKFMTI